jgi:hypothetical protein
MILEILFGAVIYLLVGGLVCSTFFHVLNKNLDKINKICDFFNIDRVGDEEFELGDTLVWPLYLVCLAFITLTLYRFRNIDP